MTQRWRVEVTETAARHIREITDKRVQGLVLKQIRKLEDEPEKQGKPLLGELMGLYSMRAVGQRYRIVYSLKHETIVVCVIAVGLRREGNKRDIYRLAERLVNQGLLG